MYKAVIFDLDGTLLNTLSDLTDSVNTALRTFHQPKTGEEQVRAGLGNGAANLIRSVIPDGEANPYFRQVLAFHVSYYEKHCLLKTVPFPGIMEMMRSLKENGIRMAVVSNKGDGAVRELCAHFFEGLADEAVGEREGIRRKPAPDSVLEAMRRLQSSPEDTLYVGDSEVDHATAGAAGVPAALVTWGFRDRGELEKLFPDYLINAPGELVSICLSGS